MEQYPTDRNQWETELTDDDNFLLERLGWPVLTEQEQRFFNRLESWHQAFFLSLSRHPRLKLSLEKVLVRDSKAERIYWRYADIREYQLKPIMKICHISTLVFPLIEYDIERRILEDNIIDAIKRLGMNAGGLKWQDMYGNLAASEDDQWKEYTKEGLDKQRENFLYAAVNINDLEELARAKALHWRIVKYLRVWRYFLQDINKTANAPPLPPIPTTSYLPAPTPPKPATRLDLQVQALLHIRATMLDATRKQVHAECQRQQPQLFSVGFEAFKKIWNTANNGG
jgi:hypothetical protein